MDSVAEPPFFSVVVPVTEDSVHLLCFTLDSILAQTYPSYEVIVVDAEQIGCPSAVLDAYLGRVERVYSALGGNLSGMLNQGITLCKGSYVHFLQPGEFYISRHAFEFVKRVIDDGSCPELIYTGCTIRHSLAPQQQVLQQIHAEDLKCANIPQTLQAYWFQREALIALGKFKKRYKIQGGFDLICRFYSNPGFQKVQMRRVLTDYEYRLPRASWIFRQLLETFLILISHFGLSLATLGWVLQNHLRFFRWWFRSVKAAFWKGSA